MGGSDSKNPLPPWAVREGVEYPSAIKSRLQSLSLSSAPFLQADPAYYQPFELEPHLCRLQGALTYDAHIAKWYPQLVPRRCTEEEFWRNYFSHVARIVTEGGGTTGQQAEEHKSNAAETASAGSRPAVAAASTSAAASSAAPAAAAAATPAAPRRAVSPAVPESALSPPPLIVHAAGATVPASASAAAASVPRPPQQPPAAVSSSAQPSAPWNRYNVTPQHVVDSGRELGASLVAQLAGLHHNMPHEAPLTAFQSQQSQPQFIALAGMQPAVPAVDQTRLAHAAPVRYGVIGCGAAMQTFTMPAMLRTVGARVTAVYSEHAASRDAFAAAFHIPRVHASLLSLMSDPEVDACFLATPPGSHAALAAEAARHRKPCVIEKVLARSGEECRAIAETFASANLPLFVNQHKRFLSKFHAVRQLINQQLGNIHSLHYQYSSPLAKQLHDAHNSSSSADADGSLPPSSPSPPAAHWRLDCSQSGGGLFVEFGAELFDVLDFLFGPVSHVHGDAIHSPLQQAAGGSSVAHAMENVLSATFRLCDPSVAGASLVAPVLPHQTTPVLCTASFNFVVSQQVDLLLLQGSKATLSVSLFGTDAPTLRFPDGRLGTVQLSPVENPHSAWLQQVTQELRVWRSGPAEPRSLSATSAASAVRTGQVIDAVLRGFYKDRTDAFWTRPATWRHAIVEPPQRTVA